MNKYIASLLIGTVLLSACALAPKPGNFPDSSSGHPLNSISVSNQSVLEYAGNFGELSLEEQKNELLHVNQALALNKGDIKSRMKAALIYSLPDSRLRDTVKAQNLLDDLLKEKNLDSERRILASILRDCITETNKLAQKGRDEQKRADSAQQKNEALQQMLNDLKNIEKVMVDRDQGTRK